MRFMLDTNVCIDVIRTRPRKVLQKLRRMRPDDVCVSAITLSELEYGVSKSMSPDRNRLALAEFMTPVQVAPYDDMAAAEYGGVRAELERAGTPIGALDMLIAAHALALELTLVTNNEREFRRVPGLRLANWAK